MKKKLPTMTAIASHAVAAIVEAKRTGATLSVDEALAQACSEAGGMTPGELKLAARALVVSNLRSAGVPDKGDQWDFFIVGLLLTKGSVVDVDFPAAKTWLTLSLEMGNPHAQKQLDELLMQGRLQVEISR